MLEIKINFEVGIVWSRSLKLQIQFLPTFKICICRFFFLSISLSLYGSAGKESTCNAGDLGSIPGLGRSSGEGKGYSLQYSCLENSMDYIAVHGAAKCQTQLSDFHFHFQKKISQLSIDFVFDECI